jgi:GxxExxY protein
MEENEIAKTIVDCSLKVHRALGPGLFESVYKTALSHEVSERNLSIEMEVPIEAYYKDVNLHLGYRADMIVCGKLIVEVKSVEAIAAVHQKQLLTYLRMRKLKLGLLINFNVVLIKEGIQRIVNGL